MKTGFDVAFSGEGGDCDDASVTPDEGEALECTITLTAQQASVTLDLTVSGGNEVVNDFTLRLGGDEVTDEVAELVAPNIAYSVDIDQTIVGYEVSLGGDEKCPNSLGGTVTPDEAEILTCTISLIADPAQITLEIDLVTDDGGNETEGDFTLLLDGGSVTPGDPTNVPPNTAIPIDWSGPAGYTATISGDDKCPDVLGGNANPIDEGGAITCTVTIDDVAPTLKLIKDVIVNDGGDKTSDSWILTAISIGQDETADRNISTPGGSHDFEPVYSNTGFKLEESFVEGYAPDTWSCDDDVIPNADDVITLNEGQNVTCTITNDDIAPGLTIKMILINDDEGTENSGNFVLSANHTTTSFSGYGPEVSSGPEIDAGTYDLNVTVVELYDYDAWSCIGSGAEQTDSDSVVLEIGAAVECTIEINDQLDNCPRVPNPDQLDSDGDGVGDACEGEGGMNHWDTRPTFGVNHETRETMMVDNGFIFNDNSFSITDNHHTPFDQQTIELGAVNSFAAKVYASKDLKVQEFLFGVPGIGMGHQAEMRVEVWYDNNGEIEEVKVLQDTEVIDRTSLSISHHKSKCQEADIEEKCDITFMSAVFLEPLKDNVMAIKAMDFKLRDQTTYLNDGFDISGDSLNPMHTKMIPSPTKGEGLIEVTQNEKYSDYWTSEDGRIFEMNKFGSFKQINYEFKRFQDSGNALTRQHSAFGGIIQYEQNRALNVFDATALKSELPDSFVHDISIGERITDEMIQEMIIQEHIAQKKLEAMDKQTRWN
jgi:hypothetical protein